MSVELIITQGSNKGTAAPIHPGYYLVGRHKECQIRPKSRSVSRRHCLLLRNDDGVGALDLKSTGGTFVNGQRIEPHQWCVLRDTDEIRFGKVAFTVSIREPALAGGPLETDARSQGRPATEPAGTPRDMPPASWQNSEVAEFLEEEDAAAMQQRYAAIRGDDDAASDRRGSGAAADDLREDDDLSVFNDTPLEKDVSHDTFIGDLPDDEESPAPDEVTTSKSIEVDSKPRKKLPRKPIDPKTYKRAAKRSISMPSLSMSLDWKVWGAVTLVIATLSLFGYQIYRFQNGPEIEIRENLD
ncbi:FHA domain-containing protein [Roseiconus nitratireducens]|uniref:FHA domain-containing protein n=1 Tax=Roseiconus nitratireducens TaxID=2605748 RepID=A0A5M6DA56_9BACT|nr:FHA domain-containing protein [Roseiconus nitratireducens]KAA5544421.1 FHA domain-containing protein [Roseiconus nitratireducens]